MLFLPWLPTAIHQLTTWPAAIEHPPFLTALPDLWRYLVVGRTLDLNAAWPALIGGAILLLLALRRRGQTITPLIWLLVPCVGWATGPGLLAFFGGVIVPILAPIVVLERKSGYAAMRRWIGATEKFLGLPPAR